MSQSSVLDIDFISAWEWLNPEQLGPGISHRSVFSYHCYWYLFSLQIQEYGNYSSELSESQWRDTSALSTLLSVFWITVYIQIEPYVTVMTKEEKGAPFYNAGLKTQRS